MGIVSQEQPIFFQMQYTIRKTREQIKYFQAS